MIERHLRFLNKHISKVTCICLALFLIPAYSTTAQSLPDSLSKQLFNELIQDVSEVGGDFYSDNFVSNESSYLHPIETLRELQVTGGVYLGVGPEQNFTYIAEVKPQMAFIIDIRRQNMLLHLIYKTLFALSETRAGFLSKLLSKPLYEDLPVLSRLFQKKPDWIRNETDPTITELVSYFDSIDPDEMLYKRNLREIKFYLSAYGISSSDDVKAVEYIYQSFFERQLGIQYDIQNSNANTYPTLRDLLLSKSKEGEMVGFLANDIRFNYLKKMQRCNLIIPVVGDLSGNKTLRSIARYVRSHMGFISVFYTSNVELYLSIAPDEGSNLTDTNTSKYVRFYENVHSMPINESSVFIRSYANDSFFTMFSHPNRIGNLSFTSFVQNITHFLEDRTWRSLQGKQLYIYIVTTGIIK